MNDKYMNISDELLAAYLDGNTTMEETKQVLEAIQVDENLKEVIDIATDILEIEDVNEIEDLFDGLM